MKLSKNQLTLIGLVIVVILFSSCTKSLRGIKGEGPIVTEEINLSEIDGVSLAGVGNIYVSHSEDQEITIKSHQNIIDNIDWVVNDKHLSIEFDRNVREYDQLDIYISLDVLKKLGISGAGNIKTTSVFESDYSFEAKISGSGDMTADIIAPKIELSTSGSGDIDLFTNTGNLSGLISGTGDYNLSGTASDCSYKISGAGDIFAYSLNSEEVDVNISGSGGVDVRVSKDLYVSISGSGDVYYKGWPNINTNISGSGKVHNNN